MNFIECFLKDIYERKYSMAYCKVENIENGKVTLKDESGYLTLNIENKNLKVGDKVRIFIKCEEEKIKVIRIIKVEGLSIYTEAKIINLLSKIFK